MPKADEIAAGQAIYSPLVLAAYDWFVLGFSNRFLWRCPTSALRRLYDRNVSACHVDIGVGTGYFLDRAKWPAALPEITLVDLNPNSLQAAAKRIARYGPRAVRANALAPLPAMGPFDSAGLCYLLHCLPGAIAEKAVVFDHLRPVLAPGARVFGATILQGDTPRSWAAQRLMNLYNKRRIFSNAGDTRQDLETALAARFRDVKIAIVGAVALFEACAD
jgi:SAM-dependent methyltransferase